MQYKLIPSMLAGLILTGCASLQDGSGAGNKTVSTATGATIGCMGGMLVAKLLNRDLAAGCVAGGVVGGLIGFEKARQEELDEADKTAADVMATMSTIPEGKGAVVEKIKTVEVDVNDPTTKTVKKVRTFSQASIDLPLAAKGTPEFDSAIEKIKAFAIKLADKRGSAEITLAVSPKSASKYAFVPSKDSTKTEVGSVITVIKKIDSTIPVGVQRVTVSAAKPEISTGAK